MTPAMEWAHRTCPAAPKARPTTSDHKAAAVLTSVDALCNVNTVLGNGQRPRREGTLQMSE